MKAQSGGAVRRNAQGKESKRQAILEAAVRVFAAKGYFGARMRDVAIAAAVADGTLYLYFPSKEGLLIAILEEYGRAFVQRARSDCQRLPDPRQQLQTVLERHLVSLERNRALATVFQIELRHSRAFLRAVAKGQVAEYLQLLQDIVAAGMEQGVFRSSLNPRVAARAIFGAVDELVTSWVLAERPASLREQLAPLLELLFAGLCPQEALPRQQERRKHEPAHHLT